jgi:hypothetical protein
MFGEPVGCDDARDGTRSSKKGIMMSPTNLILVPGTLLCGLLLIACDPSDEGDAQDSGETTEPDTDTDEGTTTAGDDLGVGLDESLPLAVDKHPALDPQPIEGPGYVAPRRTRHLATSDNFCFLTVVSGMFESSADSAMVHRDELGWWLTLTSDWLPGGTAAANCVPLQWYGTTLTYTGEYFWNEASPAVDLGSATSRICFLTRVQGALRGSGDRVEVAISNGRWYLKGSAASGHLLAGARCINTPRRVGPVNWSQGLPQQLIADTYWRCGLTKISGKFDGWGEKVGITVDSDYWYLGGSSYQTGVAGTAYCM